MPLRKRQRISDVRRLSDPGKDAAARLDLLELAIQGSSLGLWQWWLADDRIELDDQSLNILELRRADFAGRVNREFMNLIHPADRDQVVSAVRAALASLSVFKYEYRIICPGQSVRWISVRGRAYLDPNTNLPDRMIGTVSDITESKAISHAAVGGRAELEAVFHSVDDGVFVFDAAGNLSQVNAKACQILAFQTPDDILKDVTGFAKIFSVTDPEGRELPLEDWPVSRVLRGESFSGLVLHTRRLDLGQKWILTYSGHPVRSADGTPQQAVVVIKDISHQREIEQSLVKSQAQMETITNALPLLISYINREYIYERVNQTYSVWFERPVDQIVGHSVPEVIGEAAFAIAKPYIDTAMAGTPSGYERALPYKNGVVRHVHAIFTPDYDDHGQVKGCFAAIMDVSKEGRIREELKKNKEQLELALTAGRFGTFSWNILTDESHWSSECYNLFGFESERPKVGFEFFRSLIHPDDRQSLDAKLKEVVNTDEVLKAEFRVKSIDGNYRWLLEYGRVFRDADGKPCYILGTVQDITEQKASEERLLRLHQESESARIESGRLVGELEQKTALLETILEQMPMAVVIGEAPSGKLILSNPHMNKVWRHEFIPADSIEDYRSYIGFHPDGRPFEGKDWPLARAIATGEIVVNEDVDVLRGDNTRGYIRLSAAPVRDKRGTIIAGVVLCEDVTDQKRNAEELQKAKELAERSNQLKSAFLANMSHEIRTPLVAILGFAELMKDFGLEETQRAKYLEVIHRNGKQLTAIIDDILDLSKIEAGEMKFETLPMCPRRFISEAMGLLSIRASEKGIQLQSIVDDSVPEYVVTDPLRLKQIVLNIVGNAIKFTNSGGVRLDCKYQPTDSDAGRLIFEIQDSGIGISSEQRSRLFKAFSQADESVTRKYGGSGLGLALSKKLATALGGDVRLINSQVGKGSTFLVEVKVKVEHAAHDAGDIAQQSKALSEVSNLDGLNILLVEDASDIQQLVASILKAKGAAVEVADHGQQGMQRALSGNFDVVLMDVQMPVMDGLTATQKLRAMGYSTPIIALTAHAMLDMQRSCLDSGFTDVLVKPISIADMIEKIREYSTDRL